MKDGQYGATSLFADDPKMKDGDKLPLVITQIKDIPGNWRFTLPIKNKSPFLLKERKL